MPRKNRPIVIKGKIALVPLSQGMVAVIDAADVDLVAGKTWCVQKGVNTFYAVRTTLGADQKTTTIRMHHVIMGEKGIDHMDGDGLNNRRANLRKASATQNNQNGRVRANNKTGLKGVVPGPGPGFRAFIRHSGKQHYLGYFDTPEAAHAAYCDASRQHHGDFGRIK